MKVKIIVSFVFAAVFSLPVFGQNNQEFDLGKIQKELMEMQRRMMQSLGGDVFPKNFAPFGDSTSSYFFKMDTTFSGDGAQFFQFGFPEHMDSISSPDQFFKHFFDLSQDFDKMQNAPDGSEYLDENGDSDLLPEEKLRLKEEEEKSGKQPENKESDGKKKEKLPAEPMKKRKTVRI